MQVEPPRPGYCPGPVRPCHQIDRIGNDGKAGRQINIGDLSRHPACVGVDRLTLCKALYAEMEKAGVDTRETKGVIQSYEAKARVAAGEIPPFFCKEVERYEAAEAKADGTFGAGKAPCTGRWAGQVRNLK